MEGAGEAALGGHRAQRWVDLSGRRDDSVSASPWTLTDPSVRQLTAITSTQECSSLVRASPCLYKVYHGLSSDSAKKLTLYLCAAVGILRSPTAPPTNTVHIPHCNQTNITHRHTTP